MKNNGNWIIRSTRKIFENDFFRVVEDDVVQPDGNDGAYATIDLKPGAAVLPMDNEGYVYLTHQFRYAHGEKRIEAVVGAIDGEDALAAAKREAKEELGIEAEEWVDLGVTQAVTSITNSTSHLFLAKRLKFGEAESEGTEEIEPVKMKLGELVEKVMSGEIVHGDTCILALKAVLQKKDGSGRHISAA